MKTKLMRLIKDPDLFYGVPFFGGLILQIFAVDLFRLTFIPAMISVGIYLGAGCIGFLLLRKKLIDRQQNNFFGMVIALTWCIVSIGGILTFLLLGANYYLAKRGSTRQSFQIVDTGTMGGRFSKCVETYAVIKREGLAKEIVFSCEKHGLIADHKTIDLSISEGALGFDIIRNKQITE